MDGAILTFDGIGSLTGCVKTNEDYFEFRTYAALSDTQLNDLHRATIKIDGRTEGVIVEDTNRSNSASDQNDEPARVQLTLRRDTTSAGSLEGQKHTSSISKGLHQTLCKSKLTASPAVRKGYRTGKHNFRFEADY